MSSDDRKMLFLPRSARPGPRKPVDTESRNEHGLSIRAESAEFLAAFRQGCSVQRDDCGLPGHESADTALERLTTHCDFTVLPTQRDAWPVQIDVLQENLQGIDGSVLMETLSSFRFRFH